MKKMLLGVERLTVIVTVDERNGRAFLGKRLSRDQALCEDVLCVCDGRALTVTPKSAPLFSGARLSVREDLFDGARSGEVFFSEVEPLLPVSEKITTLVVYRWNRRYPSDLNLDLTPEACGLRLISAHEFVGKSHEKITREEYRR